MAVTRVARSALVAHSAERMFALVNDVRRYPEFVAGCTATEVLEESEQLLAATLQLKQAGIGLALTTRNQLQPPTAMQLSLQDGPFKRLAGSWTFQPLSEAACKVSLTLEFELSGSLASFAAGKLLAAVANNLVDGFARRADKIYPAASAGD
jgi:ribosome-associated toxin RatA of RatAB toxin-antitoxin module